MFEVYELDTMDCYMVYGIRSVKNAMGGDNTFFLFYNRGEWVWKSADSFEPKL
jgi:hypothetical protein